MSLDRHHGRNTPERLQQHKGTTYGRRNNITELSSGSTSARRRTRVGLHRFARGLLRQAPRRCRLRCDQGGATPGRRSRGRPPFRDSAPPGADGLLFAYYNNNKRGITLDWTREEALPLLEELSAIADVVLISPDRRRPIAGLGDSPPYLSWLPKRTLLCSITPYGLTGPWRGWRATSFTSFASSGGMHPVGPDAGPPLAMPGQQLYDFDGVGLRS